MLHNFEMDIFRKFRKIFYVTNYDLQSVKNKTSTHNTTPALAEFTNDLAQSG